MHILWGSLMVAAGLFMVVCASLKSQFIIYRLMVARSKILWGENVHRFHLVAGTLVIVFGSFVALGTFSKAKGPREAQDLESIRAALRAQVASGELTREEAVVRLAQATKQAKLGTRKKGKGRVEKASPELEAYGKDLKERMAKGEMTGEEATAAWIKAALDAGEITKEEAEAKEKK